MPCTHAGTYLLNTQYILLFECIDYASTQFLGTYGRTRQLIDAEIYLY